MLFGPWLLLSLVTRGTTTAMNAGTFAWWSQVDLEGVTSVQETKFYIQACSKEYFCSFFCRKPSTYKRLIDINQVGGKRACAAHCLQTGCEGWKSTAGQDDCNIFSTFTRYILGSGVYVPKEAAIARLTSMGYFLMNGRYVVAVIKGIKQVDAEALCQQTFAFGSLFVPRTIAEAHDIRVALELSAGKSINNDKFWFGMKDDIIEGLPYWVDNTPFTSLPTNMYLKSGDGNNDANHNWVLFKYISATNKWELEYRKNTDSGDGYACQVILPA